MFRQTLHSDVNAGEFHVPTNRLRTGAFHCWPDTRLLVRANTAAQGQDQLPYAERSLLADVYRQRGRLLRKEWA